MAHMVNPVKQSAFRFSGRLSTCKIEDTIVLAGSPRSGTTWLLEIFRTLNTYKALNEPLMYEEARHENGFNWRTHIPPHADAPVQKAYLHKVLTGQLGISPAWYFESRNRLAQLVEHGKRGKLVVKFCRLNRMLHWFCKHFEVQGPVFIIRHPCAVVASMMKHGAWDEKNLHGPEREMQALHNEKLPSELEERFQPILDSVSTQVEALAVMWCLDHYVPLIHHAEAEFPWILAPYERLVSCNEEELRRITDALSMDMTPQMVEQLGKPSASIRDRPKEQARAQLSKWKDRLTAKQIDSVLRIVDAAGLSNAYTDKIEPSYRWLNSRQHAEARW